jgi:tRNA threonylcarbamoyladenosine biosynthesis protein TsaB
MPNIPKYTLAIETSTQKGSLSLLKDGAEVDFWAGSETPTISSALLPQISALLAKNNVSLNNLDMIAVSAGPGSFTGTRIGLSTVRALQTALNIPGVGVSLLEALAWSVKDASQRVAALIPAGRTEVYYQEFGFEGAQMIAVSPVSCADIEDVPALLKGDNVLCVATGDLKAEHLEFIERETLKGAVVAGGDLAKYVGEIAINMAMTLPHPPENTLHPIYVKEAFTGPGNSQLMNLEELKIAPVSADDIPEVLKIHEICNLAPWSEESYQNELKSADSLLYTSKLDRETIGFIAARLITQEDVCEILNIGVLPKFQRKKIGESLLLTIFLILEGRSHTVWLEVREGNEQAIRFYHKHGFQQVGKRNNFYQNPAENALLMQKTIG